MASTDFYCRYFVGHKGRVSEFMEIEIYGDGKIRYANSSNYGSRNSSIIRKEVVVSDTVIKEIKRIIEDSTVMDQSDKKWPEPSREDGRQELEIKTGSEHIYFTCSKLKSLVDIQNNEDEKGLLIFYYTVQDLKTFIFSLITLHFRIKPIP